MITDRCAAPVAALYGLSMVLEAAMVYVYTIGVVVLLGVMLWLASTRKYQLGWRMFGVFLGLTLCMALVIRELFVPDLPWWSAVFLAVVIGASGYVRYYAMSRK